MPLPNLMLRKQISFIPIFCIHVLLLFFAPVQSRVSLALPFSNHMVLQRNIKLPIWGNADANELITVLFRGQSKSTRAEPNGRWRVDLDPVPEGGPFDLVVKGKNSIIISDIMVGEVWICSGQSNMQIKILTVGGANLDSIKSADLPNFRYMNVKETKNWIPCNPNMALNLSATGFYFGRELHRALNIPIGLIIIAEGGTAVEQWMDTTFIYNDSEFKSDTSSMKGELFRKYIQPVAPFAIKGFLWYQGETNAEYSRSSHPNWEVKHYKERFKAMIMSWRNLWRQGEIPFNYAQIANYNVEQSDPEEISAWAELREAQRLNLTLPNTSMAVLIDIGDAIDVHPINKWDVGKRLALPALRNSYGKLNLEWSGPSLYSVESRGTHIRIVFSHAKGLIAKNTTTGIQSRHPFGFTLAGSDQKWHWGEATIMEDTVIITAPNVSRPTMVRYGWANNPNCNLFNSSGLPASPFHVDISDPKDSKSWNASPLPLGTLDEQSKRKAKDIPRNALGQKMSGKKAPNWNSKDLSFQYGFRD